MKIRPGRKRSLVTGILVLVITAFGLVTMSGASGMGFPRMGGTFALFKIIWLVFGLVAAGVSFYNAFSKEGMTLYEIEPDRESQYGNQADDGNYCPQCGKPVSEDDRFCRNCGAQLRS